VRHGAQPNAWQFARGRGDLHASGANLRVTHDVPVRGTELTTLRLQVAYTNVRTQPTCARIASNNYLHACTGVHTHCERGAIGSSSLS
jgi:hypothetical protein